MTRLMTAVDTMAHKHSQEIELIVIGVKLYFILPIFADCALSLCGETKHFQNLLY